MGKNRQPNAKPERNRKIYIHNQEGLSCGAIAQLYGISRERVRQICLREERLLKRIRYDMNITSE